MYNDALFIGTRMDFPALTRVYGFVCVVYRHRVCGLALLPSSPIIHFT